MKAYNCIVRPAGQITHEVPKLGISAKEIMLLRFIHGSDSVIRIVHVGDLKLESAGRPDLSENDLLLRRLANDYTPERVSKVFNVNVIDFEDTRENDPNSFIKLSVIENEAMGRSEASLTDVAREAGPARQSAGPDETPFIVGRERGAGVSAPAME
jgi:hypothetical protein